MTFKGSLLTAQMADNSYIHWSLARPQTAHSKLDVQAQWPVDVHCLLDDVHCLKRPERTNGGASVTDARERLRNDQTLLYLLPNRLWLPQTLYFACCALHMYWLHCWYMLGRRLLPGIPARAEKP